MTVDIHSEEGQIIRQLIPLSTMPINQFESLCNIITVDEVDTGAYLFKINDTGGDLVYLLKGTVSLQSDKFQVETISSGSESSRFALAHQIPRKIDAVSVTPVRYLRLNTDILNALPSISYEEDITYMVTDEPEEENDDDDWMTTLLKSPIFRALPPANLQQIIMGLEDVHFKKGETIINQGDIGDYYYLIKKGLCMISRKPTANAKEIKLAQLRTQDTFGEDSLLSGEPRNVTITALTDIRLLRLSKEKFLTLIKEPALNYISYSQLEEQLKNGAFLIDIRPPDIFNKHHLPGSVNAPFFSLRMQLKSFDRQKTIIIVCENGNSSEAAAFLLLRHRFNALILQGGMLAMPEDFSKTTSAEFEADNDGIETFSSVNSTAAEASSQVELSKQSSESKESYIAPPNQLEILKTENQKLKKMLLKVSTEKEELEKRYRILYKQTEKLKTVLNSLKKNNKES